jgi:hypothetical protein
VKATAESLFSAIVLQPNNLALRKQYAQLVGGERGEFIELQIAFFEQLQSGGRATGAGRIEFLFKRNRELWSKPLLAEAKLINFLRGFVEHVQVDARWFVDNYKRLYASAPIRHLDVAGLINERVANDFSACPGLEQIAGIALLQDMHSSALSALAECRHLSQLRYLSLSELTVADVDKVTVLRALPQLQICNISDFTEELQLDYEGSVLAVEASPSLVQFETTYGEFHALHEVSRTRSYPKRARY